VYSGLYSIHSWSLQGEDSSECIESAEQPSSTEKSSSMTLRYVMQNDSVCGPCDMQAVIDRLCGHIGAINGGCDGSF